MQLRWLKGSKLDLKPTFPCLSVLVHTINRKQPDGTMKDQTLLVVKFTEDQMDKVLTDFPCVRTGDMMLGVFIVPLEIGKPIWTWTIEGYPDLEERYYAFDIEAD